MSDVSAFRCSLVVGDETCLRAINHGERGGGGRGFARCTVDRAKVAFLLYI